MGFSVTVALSFLFLFFQFVEYIGAAYGISDGIYGSVFYLLTGFHGFHVIIGTIFLIVCFIRFLKGHFNPRSFSGFLFAA
jgi:cytochrome c oxidase subunit 3